jgi:hypothetical protein
MASVDSLGSDIVEEDKDALTVIEETATICTFLSAGNIFYEIVFTRLVSTTLNNLPVLGGNIVVNCTFAL